LNIKINGVRERAGMASLKVWDNC